LSAKGIAPSAGSTSGTGTSRGLFARSLATRGASFGSDGIGAPSSRILIVALFAVSALFLLLASAPAADAAPKKIAGIIGEETDAPGDPGEFRTPAGVAVNQTTGEVYVVDQDRNRIQRFEADGDFISQFGSPGSEEGQFTFQSLPDIAIDPTDGSVYVADSGNNRIQKFSEDGTFLYTFGWNVDIANPSEEFEICTDATAEPDCQGSFTFGAGEGEFSNPVGVTVDTSPGSVGDVLVGDLFNNRIQRFDSSGNYVSQFSTLDGEGNALAPFRVGVDSVGNIYIVAPNEYVGSALGGAYKFDSGGSLIGKFAPGLITYSAYGLAIDPADDHVFVGDTNEFGALIREFDSTGTLIETHPFPSGYVSPGLAVRSSTGNLYASTGTGGGQPVDVAYRVYIYTDDGATPPTVTISTPTEVAANSAVFHGTVDPNGGLLTKAHFELSTDGVTWTRATPDVDVGKGDDPVPVDQAVTGLVPSTEYEVRLVANKGFGNADAFSPVLTFETESIPPTAVTLSTSVRGTTTASLFGRVNPSGQETTYFFEYGLTDAYGEKAPDPAGVIPAGGADKIVSTSISGLQPGTTYHYRIVAENDEGQVFGLDETFSTQPAAAAPKRAFEMVTPPFKATRSTVALGGAVGNNANAGVPSADGETVGWSTVIFPLTEDVKSSADGDNRFIFRTPTGWQWETLNTRPAFLKDGSAPTLSKQDGKGSSGDLRTIAWQIENGEIIASPGPKYNFIYTRRSGTGLGGFNPWLTDPTTQIGGPDPQFQEATTASIAQFNDAGTAMLRWGPFRELAEDPSTPGDDDPSGEQQGYGTLGGRAVYLVRADDPDELPTARPELVNECTGTLAGGDATILPTGPCEEGTVTEPHGASGGADEDAGVQDRYRSGYATALSNDGNRVFFQSPDTNARSNSVAYSAIPQLFVRQYDSNGEPTVRWISRPEAGLPVDSSRGANFQRASRDGRYVYFKTNARLVAADSSNVNSWDLYRYELPASLDEDPANGTLTRISGGPAGTADPVVTNINFDDSNASGVGTPLRYLSDDGKRAYFLTSSPIAGADTTPAEGVADGPSGTPGNTSVRNLYLFDDTGGSPEYTFITTLPYKRSTSNQVDPDSLNACASSSGSYGVGQFQTTSFQARSTGEYNCFHGTKSGGDITFFSRGQLTADDTDGAGDVYVYSLEDDELTRVSAPLPGQQAYKCITSVTGVGNVFCNGDFGVNVTGRDFNNGGAVGNLDTSGGWGRGGYYNVAEDAEGNAMVFFATRAQLIPEDTNGNHWDVYEWSEGRLSLISPGNTEDDSFYSGNSTDGQDVFIFTSARIDPREIDDSDFDIYDARIGGGFPYTPPPRPCDVLGHQCRGAASQAPALTASPTQNPNGTGNVVPKKCAKGKVAKKGKCVPKKCRKGQVRRKGKCVKKQGAKNKAAAKNRGAK